MKSLVQGRGANNLPKGLTFLIYGQSPSYCKIEFYVLHFLNHRCLLLLQNDWWRNQVDNLSIHWGPIDLNKTKYAFPYQGLNAKKIFHKKNISEYHLTQNNIFNQDTRNQLMQFSGHLHMYVIFPKKLQQQKWLSFKINQSRQHWWWITNSFFIFNSSIPQW